MYLFFINKNSPEFKNEIKTMTHHQAQNNIYFSVNTQPVIRVQQGTVG